MHETRLSPDSERYSRQRALPRFGREEQLALADAAVLVVGAGALGSQVIPALAAAGVGRLGIVDDDIVELSNLHRQLIHGTADIGSSKVASAARSVAAIDPEVRVETHQQRFTADSALELARGYDLIVDGSDNFPTRYLCNDAAALLGLPLVWGAVSQYDGQVGVAAPSGPDYRDLFPTPPPAGSVLSCAEGGVLPTVAALVGSLMATEVIKLLTGIGEPLIGRVNIVDGLGGTFASLDYARDPEREPVTGLIDYELFCGVAPASKATALTDVAHITVDELRIELAASPAPLLLDVREPHETATGTLPGAVLLPLSELTALSAPPSVLADERRDAPVVVYCQLGIRSERAAAILGTLGVRDVRSLVGGIEAWRS